VVYFNCEVTAMQHRDYIYKGYIFRYNSFLFKIDNIKKTFVGGLFVFGVAKIICFVGVFGALLLVELLDLESVELLVLELVELLD